MQAPSASLSRNNGQPLRAHVEDDDSDVDDPVAFATQDRDIYSTDPLSDPQSTTSQPASRFSLSNFIPQGWSSRVDRSTPPPPPTHQPPVHSNTLRRRTTPIYTQSLDIDGGHATELHESANGFAHSQDAKDGAMNIDWYIEGPGRRVGYDDLTAIDWIFEYAKERQRMRYLLSGASGILGYAKRLLDASQIWWILVCTGVATGFVAAAIDVISDWLGDLRRGVCTNSPFYLNRGFCCWGYKEQSECSDWKFWGTYVGIGSKGGAYTLEYFVFVVISVLFAVIAAYLVKQFSSYAKQSGIPELKTVLAGFVMKRLMNTWTLTIKSIGLCFAVASGLWLGKEGPLVHVACCLAHLFLRLSPALNENEARKREVLSAAAAAGISVAFGAPVGGVLFSLEQMSFYFPDKTMWQSFVCAMIAAMTLHALNPFRTEQLVLYQIKYLTNWHAFELIPFAILGILGGVYGGLFIKLNMRIARWRKNYNLLKHPVLEVAVFALITSLINFPNKYMRAQSSELIETLFSECSELQNEQLGLCGRASWYVVSTNLIVAAILGFLLTSVTFGLQLPAGILLPSMAVGALIGRTVGLLIRELNENLPELLIFNACEPDVHCVTAGTYAVIGAAATLAGATRMTVSIVVIMFELTGALTFVLPIMISVMISKWVGDAFGQQGIYESWISFNGYPFLDNRDDTPAPDVAAAHVMTKASDLVVITANGHTLQSLDHLLKTHPFRGFPVIASSQNRVLLGYISRTELTYALHSTLTGPRKLPPSAEAYFSHQPQAEPNTTLDLRPWMDQTPITLSAKSSLQLATDMFLKLGLRYIMFCEKGALKGILTKKDIWYVLDSNGERRGRLREDTEGEQRGLLRQGDGSAVEDEEEERSGFRRTSF